MITAGRRIFTTYFDQRYLPKGLTMLRSLLRWDADALIFPLCLDAETKVVLDSLGEPRIRTLTLADMHAFEPRLLECAGRPMWPFYATHKPVVPLYIFSLAPDCASVTHIDADTWFLSSTAPFVEEMVGASIGLSPHRHSANMEGLRQYGEYNAGFIYWRNDDIARACLYQYREQCLEWCEPTVLPDGRFMNQGYLTQWPQSFPNVRIIQHPGLNVGFWNLGDRRVTRSNQIEIDGQPLIFFHFSSMWLLPDGSWFSHDAPIGQNLDFMLRDLINPYLAEVEQAQVWLDGRWPGLQKNAVSMVPGQHMRVRPLPERTTPPMDPQVALEKLQSALQLHQQGRLDQAEAIYREVLAAHPQNFDALQLLATATAQRGRSSEAADLFVQALRLNPRHPGVLSNLGAVLVGLGRDEEAVAILSRGLEVDPNSVETLNNVAVALARLGRFAHAVEACDLALKIRPDLASALATRGFALNELGRGAEAVADLDKAVRLNPQDADAWNNRGVALNRLGHLGDALLSFTQATDRRPAFARAWLNRGDVLMRQKRNEDALAAYSKAIDLQPDLLEALNNRGKLLADMGQYDRALASYDAALRRDPAYVSALINRAIACIDLKRFEEALASCNKVLAVSPNQESALGLAWFAKLQLCDWSGIEEMTRELLARIARGEAAVLPFSTLMIPDAAIQHQAALTWASAKHAVAAKVELAAKRKPGRIRVGYFSADFRNHAVMELMAGMFERHDRKQFELFAFSLGPETDDEMRRRTVKAFDHFLDVRSLADEAIARMARERGLDIAIDLTGFTKDGRVEIFAHRAAPVQASFLGFTGTTGLPWYDYLIADAICIPEDQRQHYSEKIVWLPDSYQPNDSKRPVPVPSFTRAQCGLPEDAFVFCCFNNSYKITPGVFAAWMRILKRTPQAVLWLFADNASAQQNLAREAAVHGVGAERLIFAQRTPRLEDHLGRYRLADLFLDTTPYNAHTTTSDALWAGLPVLTRIGSTFAGRVAASLLTAVGLPEMITDTPQAYEDLAVALAFDPARVKALKEKLAASRTTCSLFDTVRFTRNFEKALLQMHQWASEGLKPDHLRVADG